MAYNALILRNPARAEATVAEFEKLGITSWCAQLIETIWPEELHGLEAMVQRLVAGEYSWLVLTSVNTVVVLEKLLASYQLPASLRIASVGEKTSDAITAKLGRSVDFQPEIQSASGMLDKWQLTPGTRICYPHGDLAKPTLSAGLLNRGMVVDEVIAYQTVSTPCTGTVVDPVTATKTLNVLQPEAISAKLEQMDLLVFSAPSVVRRFRQLIEAGLPASTRTIAIGQPTAKALRAADLPVHAIAAEPTPQGLARAAKDLLQLHGLAVVEETK
ncbi:uroporphyrinogen-III synthase [Arthrobacter sp. NIO-1057]|uniref:uroporphyrinogen-III synthase n=1 Tax=Arthrobacter sp. NIO-1057 TaxID=993071 RepID=UPI00071DBF09|nr:uroporphyrinogen-III synthase [Arthrobacter sp. NIO-1057]KSU67052.1 hypothetical protein AS038_04515 [Arthrobacter sp. NIO-1057]SCB95607.1 uroporphyrinogen-III synthase [Arthrobacter sp. NIO-1057]